MSTQQAIGIDIGGTNLRLARVNRSGTILESVSERISRDARQVLERIKNLARQLDGEFVTGLGVGVPGRVDAANRRVLSGGFLDLSDLTLAESLEAEMGKPVLLDSDCNMALTAEIAVGAARGHGNVAMFTIGTGIGGAIALDGLIVRGRSSAGQLGHLTVDVTGRLCACGRHGCVETTSSGTALGRLVQEAGLPADTRIETLLANRQENPAKQLINAWIDPLRAAIDSLVAVVDPELVLLGGGLGRAAFEALSFSPAVSPWYQCSVAPAVLGDEAGVIGSALSVLNIAPGCHTKVETRYAGECFAKVI
jgi:glucokinase